MYRIRLHGRGGQGIKTACRILGRALFLAGPEVQDAPRYGAERRGAPIFAYVRASDKPVKERGVIRRPDPVVVADHTLVGLPVAGVAAGADSHTVILINSDRDPQRWKEDAALPGLVIGLPLALDLDDPECVRLVGAACVRAAAGLLGMITSDALQKAVRVELAGLGAETVNSNESSCLETYDAMEPHAGSGHPAVEPRALCYLSPTGSTFPWTTRD